VLTVEGLSLKRLSLERDLAANPDDFEEELDINPARVVFESCCRGNSGGLSKGRGGARCKVGG
jgi:hypothetical protein